MKFGFLGFAFLSVLLGGGLWLYDIQQRNIQSQVQEQLTNIAHHKVDQISGWRRERLGDAEVLTGNHLLTDGLVQWLSGSSGPHILVELQAYLEPLRQPYGYLDHLLVDGKAHIQLNIVDQMPGNLDDETRAALFESWRTFQPVMTDILDGSEYPHPHLSLVAPLFKDLHPAGAIILFIDPRRQLFPLLQAWPSPSASAETLLIRRHGDDVLFLNEISDQSVHILRQPLNRIDSTVTQAIMGTSGLILGEDNRHGAVAAVALSIPNTPWIMLAKVSRQEIFASGQRETLVLGIGLLAILGLTSSLAALGWQIRKRNDERRLREAEAAERRSLEQFLNLFNQSLDAIFLLGLDFRLIDANPAAVKLLGYSRDDLIRLQLPDILAEVERPRVFEIAPRLLSGAIRQQEWLHQRKDGTTFPAEVTAKTLNSERFFATVRDISLQKRVERLNRELNEQLERRVAERTAELNLRTLELFKSQERFCLAMDASSEGLWDGDLRTGKFYYSPGFFKMLGYEPDELPGNIETWIRLLHPDDRRAMLKKAREMLHTGGIELECQMVDKEGHNHWILCRGAVVAWNNAGEPLRAVGTHQDITERRRILIALQNSERGYRELTCSLERQVADRTAELSAANAAKSRFLAHMSHEIRTPMNAILGLTQLLEKESHTPTQGEMLKKISESSDLLVRIVNDILDFSKIEAGQLRIENQPFMLSWVIERVNHLLAHMADAKGLVLRVPSIEAEYDNLIGDALRLEQVLINLAGNSIKFTEYGEVEIICKPREIKEASVLLRLEIRDTGIGIMPEAMENLFQPFTQADNTITRRYGGTGLGLAISKRLVELMGGHLGVSSQPNLGSTFWLEIPFLRSNDGLLSLYAKNIEEKSRNDPCLVGLRVLAVDDKRINLIIIERALTMEGATVSVAMDGREALQILYDRPDDFDVVLMDVQMPVMDGLSATREIRRSVALSHLPVIILSAGVFAEEREAALNVGADDFLAKPINLKEVNAVLGRYTKTADPSSSLSLSSAETSNVD